MGEVLEFDGVAVGPRQAFGAVVRCGDDVGECPSDDFWRGSVLCDQFAASADGHDPFGGDHAGLGVEGHDSPVAVLEGDLDGDPVESCLRDGVRHTPAALAGKGEGSGVAGRAGQVDDGAASTLDHVGQCPPGDVELRGEVAEYTPIEDVGVDVEEAVVVARTHVDGVVDECVEVA